jgi:hypothetical protein
MARGFLGATSTRAPDNSGARATFSLPRISQALPGPSTSEYALRSLIVLRSDLQHDFEDMRISLSLLLLSMEIHARIPSISNASALISEEKRLGSQRPLDANSCLLQSRGGTEPSIAELSQVSFIWAGLRPKVFCQLLHHPPQGSPQDSQIEARSVHEV